ncbi:MAG: endopeptidase La [Verrucomicrobiae bacterium]|nr:endopeptidase La [Verrucomicrobiae bacterium]
MTEPDTEFIRILTQKREGSSEEAQQQKTASKQIPKILPILGLEDIVIFPGMLAPLIVESHQSAQLIDDAVGGDRWIGLVLQKNVESKNPGPDDLYKIGCAGKIVRMLKYQEDVVRILIEGVRRFKIVSFESTTPYLRANIEILEEKVESSLEIEAMARKALEQFQQIVKMTPALAEQVKVAALNTNHPGRLADLIASHVNINLEERQTLLETTEVKQRLSKLLPLLAREIEVLNIGSKIQSEVANAMSKSQRDYYLREQLRAIQKELGEEDPNAAEIKQLKETLEKANLPEEARKVANKELERLQQLNPAIAEYSISRNYLDWILSLPWNKTTQDNYDLEKAAQILDKQHYGLQKVKDRLLEFLAVLRLRQEIKGPILCLVGPPGTGKTSLGKSVADALGRKFIRISLGGLRDEAEIRGHRRTYVGAMPGRIIQSLRRVESRNPVILFDELDKIGSDFRGDPASALLEVLDPQQNNSFVDHYLDIPFDLSRVLFITTANWLEPVHPALRDRLEIINIPSYTTQEKYHIANRHIIPRLLDEHGLKPRQIKIHPSTIKSIITDYTREAGVRQLERELAALMRKAALDISRNGSKKIVFKPEDLVNQLGQPEFKSEEAEKISDCGIALGMAWTPVGGEILFVEATKMPGSGKLILTGSLGDVMKESAQTALSYLRSQADRLGLDFSNYDKTDIHIHVPAGATPKDGPSAGVTIIAAITSVLMKKPVRSEVSMTGEISLRGRVLKVGGIKEKVLAAARHGIKEVILPEDNKSDWHEVPDEVKKKLTPHFIKKIDEIFPVIFGKSNN